MQQAQAAKPLIQVEKLNKYFMMGSNQLHVLRDIDLTIAEGDFVSVMGPSGSGKSTLINVIGFLDNEFQGEYFFQGERVGQRSDAQISALRNQMVGFVFQSFNLIETMTIKENVRLPLIYSGYSSRSAQARVEEVLDKVGLLDKINVKPYELSGGQRQRVAIARALVNSPRFIIADEPTGALDTKTSQAVMEILADLHRNDGTTIVMVTHDPSLQMYATRHIVIIDGVVRAVDPQEAQELIMKFQIQREES